MLLEMLKYAKNVKKSYFFFRPIRGLHFWKVNLRGKQNRVIRHCLAHTINDTNFCQVTWICSQMPWKWRKSNTFTSTQKTRGLWKNFTAEKLLKIKFCTHIVNLRSNFQKKKMTSKIILSMDSILLRSFGGQIWHVGIIYQK